MRHTQCTWIEGQTNCHKPAIQNKSYCDVHQKRAYLTLPVNMADFLIEQGISHTPPSLKPLITDWKI